MKDIKRLNKDIKKGVKFSDLPKKSLNVDLSDSSDASDDEEDFVAKKVAAKKAAPKKEAKKEESDSSDDEEDLLKINISKAGRQ